MPKSYLLIPGPTQGTDPRARIADIRRNATEISLTKYEKNLISGMNNYNGLTQNFDKMKMPKSYLLTPGPSQGHYPMRKIVTLNAMLQRYPKPNMKII